ncbi:MAG: 50S ribosomal protein L24 [Prevotella sp.]|jgi:large subunit ribosomal protein L24|nr:50S ribosomal protein L24 [Prevotella sp.]
MSKLHIKKGDMVLVISGKDNFRTTGSKTPHKVLKVLVDEQRAIVEGVNIVSKSTKPSAKNPQGGIVKQEAPIHISNLMLVDPKSGEPTRVSIKHEGKNVIRISKKSGEVIK